MELDNPGLFERIVELSPVIAFVWRLEAGWPVEFVSHSITRLGYGPNEFRDGTLHYADIVHPEDLERVNAEVQGHLDAKAEHFKQRYRLLARGGAAVWIDDWTTINYDSEGEPEFAHGIILDVTENRGLAERLSDITSALAGALFEYTVFPDGTDSILFLNDYCETLWEIPADEIDSDPAALWEMIHPEDLPGMRDSVRESMEKLEIWLHEWRIELRDGREKWLQASGSPRRLEDGSTRWATSIIDITEMKRAVQAKVAVLNKAVQALAAVVEARDPYTAGHEANVAKICVKIGHYLGLSKQRLDGLELAATIHDIGKISIPAEILSKPSKLDPVEYELMKSHAMTGANFIRDIEFSQPIATMIEQHHERLDGSGYPSGLQGDEILLEARIIAVADTFEAIASHRPYRPGLGMDKALEALAVGRGSIFDEVVVDACLDLVASGEITEEDTVGLHAGVA